MVIYKADYIIIRTTIPMFKNDNLPLKSEEMLSLQGRLYDKTPFPLLICHITPTFKLKLTQDR